MAANSKERHFELTNDAFFYLLENQEPIDEANLVEANSVKAQFLGGFTIADNWLLLDDTGKVSCTIISRKEPEQIEYDAFLPITKSQELRIKWLAPDSIKVWRCYAKSNSAKLLGEYKVYVNEYGLKCFHTGPQNQKFITGQSSLYFIKHFQKAINS